MAQLDKTFPTLDCSICIQGPWMVDCSRHPNIEILGNLEAKQLSIVSFVIRHGEKMLHHNFVVALLNDLFGIQARGGCSCAGPYGHRLLGIDLVESMRYHDAVNHGSEGIKPGWVRVNFNYFISGRTFDYILSAVEAIANDGWRLLPAYRFNTETGIWRHGLFRYDASLSLREISYGPGRLEYSAPHDSASESAGEGYLEDARRIMAEAAPADGTAGPAHLDDDLERLRWFPLPGELRATE